MFYTVIFFVNNEEAARQPDIEAENQEDANRKAAEMLQMIAENGNRVRLISVRPKTHGGAGYRNK